MVVVLGVGFFSLTKVKSSFIRCFNISSIIVKIENALNVKVVERVEF